MTLPISQRAKFRSLPGCLPWRLCLAIALTCTVAPAWADDEKPVDPQVWRQVDALFEAWNDWETPGAALAIERDGEIIYARGYGSAQLEYTIPITPSTIFHVASVSKQFTCFAIVLLAQDGKLSLDDDIRKHLPEVPEFPHTITIRHLIHHTSGLRDQWEILALAGWRLDDVITREQILKLVHRQRDLNFEPGSEHLYCNTGYTLLAEIVSQVSGQPFPEFCQERIFKPLGMPRTHFHDDHRLIVPGRAYSYDKDVDGYRKAVLSYANVGATSLFTTAEDLCRWLANLDDGRVGGKQAIEQMHEQGVLNGGKKLDYAFGLVRSKRNGREFVAHGGADAGFRTYALRVPEERLGIVVLSNLGAFDPGGKALKIADLLLGDGKQPEAEQEEGEKKPETAEAKSEPVVVAPEVLDRYVGKYHLSIGPIVRVQRLGKQLVGEIQGQARFEFVGQSDREFLVEQLNAKVVFDATDGDPCPGFEAHVGPQTIRGKRVPTESELDLDALAGVYYSSELETAYTLVVEDGHLVARHQRHPDIPLAPLGGDEFAGDQWFFGTLRLVRDADDKVEGFTVSGGRVRNLRFDRQGEK